MDKALQVELVEELGAIPGFPTWNAATCATIGTELARLFKSESEAWKIVRLAVQTFSKWEGAGIPGLRAIRDSERGDQWEEPWVRKGPNVTAYTSAYIPDCEACKCTGAVEGAGGRWSVCECQWGDPVHVSKLNRALDYGRERREAAEAECRRRVSTRKQLENAIKIKQALKVMGE